MFDLKLIRDDPAAFDGSLARRGLPPRSPEILALDKEWRAAQTKAEQLQAERNKFAREIGAAKAKGGDASALMQQVALSKDEQATLEAEAGRLKTEIDALLAGIPNLPLADVPDGKDEHDNVLARTVGTPRTFSFTPKDHVALGEGLRQMDFARAGKLSGARFVVLSGGLARLERALAAFMLDLHTQEFGYTEVAPPLLVRSSALFGTGQLPKFAPDLFQASSSDPGLSNQEELNRDVNSIVDITAALKNPDRKNEHDAIAQQKAESLFQKIQAENQLWLIPTAEVPLTNLVAGEILEETSLPLRFTAWTPCFRSEAGAAGKDTRGMIRQHQFNKVELVSIAHPDQAGEEHERMTACAEEVLKRLDLPYRVMLLCTGDMGSASRKTYDIEVWLPAQNAYREISSCSQCGEYQARRMNARFKPKESKGNRFVHTLNGSGLAVGRAMVAVLENYQQEDGSIVMPTALRPYMGGVEVLRADG